MKLLALLCLLGVAALSTSQYIDSALRNRKPNILNLDDDVVNKLRWPSSFVVENEDSLIKPVKVLRKRAVDDNADEVVEETTTEKEAEVSETTEGDAEVSETTENGVSETVADTTEAVDVSTKRPCKRPHGKRPHGKGWAHGHRRGRGKGRGRSHGHGRGRGHGFGRAHGIGRGLALAHGHARAFGGHPSRRGPRFV